MKIFRKSHRDNNEDGEALLPIGSTSADANDQTDVYSLFPDSPKMVLQWQNISVTVRETKGYFTNQETLPSKQIISNVSGIALPGNLLGIMGASGSGKTTLLNALTLRSHGHLEVKGKVLVNGTPVTPGGMDTLSAYVQQEDFFYGKLTVKEQLTFHALLRMDNSYSKAVRLQRVDEVLKELGLVHCQDTLIGVAGRIQGISGGERRRLSFAAEILSDPPIMLCDEPTSGLDAAMAQNIITVLRRLAKKGKTIICTIHQPSSHLYVLFDRIMMMAGGKLAFLGTSDEALTFFSSVGYPCPLNCCPADHFIHVLAEIEDENGENTAEEICEAFALTEETRAATEMQLSQNWEKYNWIHRDKESAAKSNVPSISVQFRNVFWRAVIGLIRDTKIMAIKIVGQVVLAFLLGVVYWNQDLDQVGVININSFVILFFLMLMAEIIVPTLHVFSEELPLYREETWNGMYSTGMYVMCKSLAELPEFIIVPFLEVVIMYFMIGIGTDWHKIFVACGVVILVSNCFVSYGYLISSINSSLGGAVALLPAMVGPLITVSGNFINMKFVSWYFYWVQYLSMFKYGCEALFINQWQDVTHIKCNINNSTCPRNGHDILELMDIQPSNMKLDIIGLIALTIIYRLLAALILYIQVWRKR